MGNVRNRRLSPCPMLINRYSLPRASTGITASYGGTYLCNVDQQIINFLLSTFNFQLPCHKHFKHESFLS
ncbi:hypothetical protein, partial [Parabacteroides distasonis]